MPKIPVTTVANLEAQTTALTVMNANFAALSAAFDQVHFRTGAGSLTDNAMIVDLDMNSKRILNLPAPTTDAEPARHGDIAGSVTAAATSATNAATSATNAAASATSAATSATASANSATASAASATAAAQSATEAEAAANLALTGLNDVTTTTPAVGDVLMKSAGDWVNSRLPWSLTVALSDETTAITTGAAKVTMRMPHAVTLTSVRASLSTASTSGLPTIDINEGGVSIFSTRPTIDENEKTTTTAATASVLSDTALADDAEITFDIDVAGTGAKGLKVTLIGTR